MTNYVRPLVQQGRTLPHGAVALAGGRLWFTHAEILSRGSGARIVPVSELEPQVLATLSASRPAVAGVEMNATRLMGILNVTPDSFSDGGVNENVRDAVDAAWRMAEAGAEILDVGGESTRPGAQEVGEEEEIRRIRPVSATLAPDLGVPISVDTRKSGVAGAALIAGADDPGEIRDRTAE